MPARSHASLLLPILLVGLIGACGAGAEPSAPDSSGAPATGAGAGPTGTLTETPEILRFRAPELSGGVLRGSDYAGSEVALWFWAPW